MTCVPVYCWKQPVAVLTMASRDGGAFDSTDSMVLLSALLAPFVQTMDFTTRRAEMERLVHNVLTPLAAELSVRQGRCVRTMVGGGGGGGRRHGDWRDPALLGHVCAHV